MAAKLFAVLIFLAALASAPAAAQFGPKDGSDLRPTELERVKVGQAAPDFTLEDVDGKGWPHPSTFVIDPKSVVRWKFIEVDYKKRASNEQIRRELAKIK